MEFERLLELVGDEPIFETSLLLAGNVKPNAIRLQISRWTRSGRLYQLRRGLYAIAPPYQKTKPLRDRKSSAALLLCQRSIRPGLLWADPGCRKYRRERHCRSPGATRYSAGCL